MKYFNYVKHKEFVDNSFLPNGKSSNYFIRLIRSIQSRKMSIERNVKIYYSFCFIKIFFPGIFKIQIGMRQEGGLKGQYQWIRLYEIYKYLKKYKCKTVCEFGSGASTAMFATILGEKSSFDSFEESEYWYGRLKTILEDNVRLVDLHLKDRLVTTKDNESVCYYDFDHLKAYDLVYVDGPYSSPKEDEKDLILREGGGMSNYDVEIFWQHGIYPRIILIDGRRPTVRRLISNSNGKYDVYLKSDYFCNGGLIDFSMYRYHTVMIRK
jgi:hypothetical protein